VYVTFARSLFFFLEFAVLPIFEKRGPRERRKDVHRGSLADVGVLAGLLAEVVVAAFAARKRHDVVVFAGIGEVFVGEVGGGYFLEFGGDIHFEELDFEVFAGGPRKNDCGGQRDAVLRQKLHDRVAVLGERVGDGDGARLEAEVGEAHFVAFFDYEREKTAKIGVSAAFFVGQKHRSVRYRNESFAVVGDQHTRKLDQVGLRLWGFGGGSGWGGLGGDATCPQADQEQANKAMFHKKTVDFGRWRCRQSNASQVLYAAVADNKGRFFWLVRREIVTQKSPFLWGKCGRKIV
jgi:hypothetical protein